MANETEQQIDPRSAMKIRVLEQQLIDAQRGHTSILVDFNLLSERNTMLINQIQNIMANLTDVSNELNNHKQALAEREALLAQRDAGMLEQGTLIAQLSQELQDAQKKLAALDQPKPTQRKKAHGT